MNSVNKFGRNALVKTAKSLAAAGYSVIPAHGDNLPQQPKKPAIAWRRFQREIMSDAEIEAAFRKDVTALGIVCGRVSQLLVIDFDDVAGYQKFCRRFPTLAATRTVKTRRGFHLYFRCGQKLPSHRFEGGDIKAERAYVIAPPSVIKGFRYKLLKDVSPMPVNSDEVSSLLDHLHGSSRFERAPRLAVGSRADVDLAEMYDRLAPQLGRNNALYRCASIARDHGISQNETRRHLLRLHVMTQGSDAGYESEVSRFEEGERTIASAFSRGHGSLASGGGIPNSLREFLLREQRSTVLARLLESFRLAGWLEYSWFGLGDAMRLGERYGLNRKSVMDALGGSASVYNGSHIIARRYVAYLDNRGLKSRKRGRPAQILYQVPGISEMMRRFSLPWSPSDPIVAADVKSARAYRLALHREYLRRLSPVISLARLAARIGVNRRTIQRYNRELNVSVIENVSAFELSRDSLRSLPRRSLSVVKNATPGYWLELADGRRYPAWRHIGDWLLKAKLGAVRVCLRGLSRFVLAPGKSDRVNAPISVADFVARRSMRAGEASDNRLSSAVAGLMRFIKERASEHRLTRIPLSFESVARCIAEDKVAESIRAYLVAQDAAGGRVQRPARRGIAYRMLKQYGEGNVFMALVDETADAALSLARRALGLEDMKTAMNLLLRAARGFA